jgi:DNA-binding MarR family transcriptional regulator
MERKSLKRAHTPQKQLLPLMFEVGRMLKQELYTQKNGMPSFLHAQTLQYIKELSEKGRQPTMSDIAEYLRITPPSATALIDSFVQDRILERTADVHDRRVVRLTVSKKGIELIVKTMRQREKAFTRIAARLSKKDHDELVRLLSIITSPL